MDTQNDGLEKEVPFKDGHFLVSDLDFWGVSSGCHPLKPNQPDSTGHCVPPPTEARFLPHHCRISCTQHLPLRLESPMSQNTGETETNNILLMEEILHQLRLVVYPISYDGFYRSQVVQDFFHQQ